MQNILVPVDFSAVSRNAASYAAELARIFRSRLLLFHAYMIPAPVSEVPYNMITIDEQQQENERLIKQEANFLHTTYGIEVEWLVRIGIPSDEIKALAAERAADLIVMGIKGLGGLDKIIGSTTVNVVNKVKTPVLIIPNDAAYLPIQNITYASDYSYPASGQLFAPLLKIATTFNARTHIVYVQRKKEEAAIDKTKYESIFGGTDHEHIIIADASVKQGIHDYLQQQNCELLVMVAHKHSFFERLFSKTYTADMAYETHIPLLVLQNKG
ncbi:MAG: universal stress protein [Chitinophagaceae bacterium]